MIAFTGRYRHRVTLLALLIACLPRVASALPDILAEWRNLYPASGSDDIDCQLCHVNPSGNTPWNAYGIEIMEVYWAGGRSNIVEAIEIVEDFDSDGDGVSSIDEISANGQPGWRPGTANTHYDGQEIGNSGLLDVTIVSSNNSPPGNPVANPIPQDIPMGSLTLALHEVATGFMSPVKAVRAPGINGSLFVAEQSGRIYRVDLATGARTLFHDVSGDLVTLETNYDERGLLGLAFHPGFASNGRFYTYQSGPVDPAGSADFSTTASPDHRARVVEHWAYDPSCNSPVSELKTLMTIDQPQSNHNGGDLAFGPDGMLYIALGDGGAQNDVGNGHGAAGNAQDTTNPLGSILRIDVDGANAANGRYGIPADNPFAGSTGLDEIFAFGFRNPYRISFDGLTGDLYTGDVGQNAIEEVDRVVSGGNYGWNWKEGDHYFLLDENGNNVSPDPPPGVPTTGLIDPVVQYDHDEGVSVIGGYVYRGAEIANLDYHYVFADYFRIGGADGGRRLLYTNLDPISGAPVLNEFAMDSLADNVTGFGQDWENELYITTNPSFSPNDPGGRLLKLMSPATAYEAPDAGDETTECREYCVTLKGFGLRKTPICL